MEPKADYSLFVEHPRYGRGPNFTGLNPDPKQIDVQLHWNATSTKEMVDLYESLTGTKWQFGDVTTYNRGTIRRIANTAVVADVSQQTKA